MHEDILDLVCTKYELLFTQCVKPHLFYRLNFAPLPPRLPTHHICLFTLSPTELTKSAKINPLLLILHSCRADIARRQRERQQEQDCHESLLKRSYQESQDRHAYRLAHPAYADGRIW